MILRVVFGDGEKNGWEENQYCASDREKGGPETFWPIRFYTIMSYRTLCAQTMTLFDLTRIITSDDGSVRIQVRSEAQYKLLDDIDEWCVD